MTQKTYIIIDGNSFIHRAYNALPAFTNKDGFPTQIITGVCNMINKVINGFEHEHVVVAFDASGKNFRHDMYSEYKANRESMPDDMRIQLAPLKEIISSWGIPMLCVQGVEADDSMSTLALKAEEEGYKVILATSDKDMNQIVSDNIFILDTKSAESKEKMTLIDKEAVKVKMGVYPELVVDYLALIGDTSDNVPGVEKCGPKTALKWLESYGSIDGIVQNKDNISGKVGEYLNRSIDDGLLFLSRDLVTICKNVPIDKKATDFIGVMDEQSLLELLNKYQLRNLKKALKVVDKNASSAKSEFSDFNDKSLISDFFVKAQEENIIYVHTFNFNNEDFLLFFISDSEKVIVLKADEYKSELNDFVNNSFLKKYLISSVDTKNVLKTIYKHTNNRKAFSMLVDDARVADSIQEGNISKIKTIEYLNDTHSNFNLSALRETYKLNTATPKWDKMSLEETISVISEEIIVGKYIIENKDESYDISSANLDNKLVGVLASMEYHGALIDISYLNEIGSQFDEKINEIQNKIFEKAGQEFNISSPKQVANILFDVLEIKSKKKSTAEDVLLLLEPENPIITDIMSWRSYSKLKSTYIDGLINKADEDSFLHTTYNLTLATNGRLSSTDPNLQNLPMKTEEGRKIRAAFIPRKGYKIVTADYSQIELRILAHLSKDKKLLEAYVQEKDLHAITASEVLSMPLEDVSHEERRIGKTINFGLIYGMSEKRLASELNINKKDASEYYLKYFKYFKGIKPFFEKALEEAKENLFVKTDSGRKIHTRDLGSPNSFARSHAEKSANNAAISGTAADIMKEAMVHAFEVLQKTELDARIIMQVHDELVFEVREDIADGFASEMKYLLENTTKLSVPLIVEYKIKSHY